MIKIHARIMGFLFFLLIMFFISIYTVKEGQHALLLRLGSLVIDSQTQQPYIAGAGLHFKLPLLNQVWIFDTRLQTLDIKSSRIVTAEKKDVIVDCFVKWKIINLPLYYTRTGGNELQTQTLLEQQLNDSLRAEFGRRTIAEVVSDERANVMESLRNQVNETAKNLGITVVDVRIKRIDLPTEVSSAIYARMRAERERVASEHRAKGKAVAETLRAQADARATVIIAEAKAVSSHLRAEGDGEAARIYGDAYNKDPQFYSFYRSVNAYKSVFADKQDIVVLKPEGKFFQYFNSLPVK